MSGVACLVCGQLSLILKSGEPCLRQFADGTRVCPGLMGPDDSTSPASRQRLNRIRRKSNGICRQCSEKLASNSVAFCEYHLAEHRKKARQKYGNRND